MRRLESIEDQRKGVVTYELKGGMRICLDASAVREHGAAEIIRSMGHSDLLPTERAPVMQYGRRIGTLPPDFDPGNIKSRSFLYDPRPGDFRREGDVWIVGRTMGASDIDMVPGFRREPAHQTSRG